LQQIFLFAEVVVKRLVSRLCALTAAVLALAGSANAQDNTLKPTLAERGWKLLFNGCSLGNWQFPDTKAWVIDDNAIHYTVNGGGMIMTPDQYENFALMFDFKVDNNANSGVFFRLANPADPVQTGIEMQILDNAKKDAPNHKCGSIYDCLAPSVDATKPAGEWNHCVLVAKDNWITVKMNGRKIIEMDLNQWTTPHKNPDGSRNKFDKAYKDMPRKGNIAFQDHGGKVWYKNILIKEL
jgi:hypothetical protein